MAANPLIKFSIFFKFKIKILRIIALQIPIIIKRTIVMGIPISGYFSMCKKPIIGIAINVKKTAKQLITNVVLIGIFFPIKSIKNKVKIFG